MTNEIQQIWQEFMLKLEQRDSGISLAKKQAELKKSNLSYDELLHIAAFMSLEHEISHLAYSFYNQAFNLLNNKALDDLGAEVATQLNNVGKKMMASILEQGINLEKKDHLDKFNKNVRPKGTEANKTKAKENLLFILDEDEALIQSQDPARKTLKSRAKFIQTKIKGKIRMENGKEYSLRTIQDMITGK